MSVFENPVFSTIISERSLMIDWAALPISSTATFSISEMPLQSLIACGFKPRKILLVLMSMSVIMNGSKMQIEGLIELILQLFSWVKKKQLPSLFLRIFRLFGSDGSCVKFLKPASSILCCSLELMSGG